MTCRSDKALAVMVKAFCLALVADLDRFRFFPGGFIIRFGPVTAIRAEVPCVSVAFAAIGFCHPVLVLCLLG